MIFLEPPNDFQPKVHVSGCYVTDAEGRLLLLRRHPLKIEGGTWGVPGGKHDPGETPLQAACRELREETGLDLPEDAFTPLGTFYVRLSYGDFPYHPFAAAVERVPTIRLAADEHTEAKWVTPHEALALPLMEDEDDVLKRLYRL